MKAILFVLLTVVSLTLAQKPSFAEGQSRRLRNWFTKAVVPIQDELSSTLTPFQRQSWTAYRNAFQNIPDEREFATHALNVTQQLTMGSRHIHLEIHPLVFDAAGAPLGDISAAAIKACTAGEDIELKCVADPGSCNVPFFTPYSAVNVNNKHVGCETSDKTLQQALEEIKAWNDAETTKKVILISLTNTLDAGRDGDINTAITTALGAEVHTPLDAAQTTIADYITATKYYIINEAAGNNAGNTVIHTGLTNPTSASAIATLAVFPDCTLDTIVPSAALAPLVMGNASASAEVDQMSRAEAGKALDCSISPEIEALTLYKATQAVWTWDAETIQPNPANKCTALNVAKARWETVACTTAYPVACRQDALDRSTFVPNTPASYNTWFNFGGEASLSSAKSHTLADSNFAAATCGALYSFEAPRTGLENSVLAALAAAQNHTHVLLPIAMAQGTDGDFQVVTNPGAFTLETASIEYPFEYPLDCNERIHGEQYYNIANCCSDQLCYLHGVCTVVSGKTTCSCFEGFKGSECILSTATFTPVREHEEVENPIPVNMMTLIASVTTTLAIMFAVCLFCCLSVRTRQHAKVRSMKKSLKAKPI